MQTMRKQCLKPPNDERVKIGKSKAGNPRKNLILACILVATKCLGAHAQMNVCTECVALANSSRTNLSPSKAAPSMSGGVSCISRFPKTTSCIWANTQCLLDRGVDAGLSNIPARQRIRRRLFGETHPKRHCRKNQEAGVFLHGIVENQKGRKRLLLPVG